MYYAFSALTLFAWLRDRKGIRPVKTEWRGAGVVICLKWGTNDCIWSIISCFIKIQNGWPFWCQLTQVVLDKGC